jgi:hypothetical protein
MSALRRGWLPGVVVGVTAGVAALEAGPLGWMLAAAFAVPALVVGPRIASIGGLLTGGGAAWVIVLGRVALMCRVPGGEMGCQAPGIEPWLVASGAQLAVGVALPAMAIVLDRRSRHDRG